MEIPQLSGNNPQLQKALEAVAKVERKSVDKIDQRIEKSSNVLKLVQEAKTKFSSIRDAISPFKTVNEFRDLSTISSDPAAMTATVDKTLAQPGSYEFEVISLASTASMMTHGFPDKDRSEVGVGYVSFQTPDGDTKDVYINSSNNTLEGVARAINEANVGARASVVHDGTDAENPYRLVVAGEKTGWPNDMDWMSFNMLDGDIDLDIDNSRPAKSAVIKFNGQPIMTDENTITKIAPGLTLNLKQAKPGQTINVEVKTDIEKVGEKVKNFVGKLNDALGFIQNQNKLGPDRDPSKALGGDVVLQSVESRLRNAILKPQEQIDGVQVRRLSDLGIVFNRNGTLDFDANKFQSKLEKNFNEVALFMSGQGSVGGFAQELVGIVDGVTRRGDGMMTLREDSVQTQIKDLNRKKVDAEGKAEKRIMRARDQFAKAESALENLKTMQAQMSALK